MRTALIILGLVASTPALAQNHFLLELEGGFASPMGLDGDVDQGRSMAATFGVGGRIPGFAPAYYFVGRVGQSNFDVRGPAHAGFGYMHRDQFEYALGGRMYLPITKRFRIMLQLALGEIYDETVIERRDFESLLIRSETMALFTEAAAQYRLTNNFSLGIGTDLAWVGDQEAQDYAARSVGMDGAEVGRARVSLMTTFHF